MERKDCRKKERKCLGILLVFLFCGVLCLAGCSGQTEETEPTEATQATEAPTEEAQEIADPEPWEHFESTSFIGETYEDVIAAHGPIAASDSYEGAYIYQMSDSNLWGFFSWEYLKEDWDSYADPEDMMSASAECMGMAGSLEDMFGISESMDIAQLGSELSVDSAFEFMEENDFMSECWSVTKSADGETYDIMIMEGADGQLSPDDDVQVFRR